MKYKPIYYIGIIFILLTILGCVTTEDYQLYTGRTDFRISNNNNEFQNKFYNGHDTIEITEPCFSNNDIIDIRLQSVVFNQIFEGKVQRMFGNRENELGVFVTIYEREIISSQQNLNDPGNSTNISNGAPERRLVYSSFPRESNAPLNQINNLVYQGVYRGGDLHIQIQVVEFDKGENKVLGSVMETLVSASKTQYASIPSIYSDLLDSLGRSILSSIEKDDLIATFDMEFIPCGSTSSPKQIYLKTGDLVFVRQPQSIPIEWDKVILKADKTLDFEYEHLGPQSYITLSIMKRIHIGSSPSLRPAPEPDSWGLKANTRE